MTVASAPFRVAFYVDGYWAGEATSRALRYKVEALCRQDTARVFDFRIFCAGTNMGNPRIRHLRDFQELVSDPFFLEADLHVFEFGWHYDLFDAVLFCPETSSTAVYYHGITPMELCVEQGKAWKSYRQKLNLFKADRIFCASPYAQQDLLRFGLDEERIRLMPLPLSFAPRGAVAKADEGPVELLHVGRLVPHKGALDLLRALAGLRTDTPWRLRIVGGSDERSAPGYHAEITRFIAANGLEKMVEHVGGIANDADLSAIYAKADAVILPTRHESYCLPVIEAFAHGCHVIAYDGANVPNIANGLAMLVPSGDVSALSDALAGFVSAMGEGRRNGVSPLIATSNGPVPLDGHRARVMDYAQGFDRRGFEEAFLAEVGAVRAGARRSGGSRLTPPDFSRL
jgi:glycosyltransferase involved in cell wall biosynthesis